MFAFTTTTGHSYAAKANTWRDLLASIRSWHPRSARLTFVQDECGLKGEGVVLINGERYGYITKGA